MSRVGRRSKLPMRIAILNVYYPPDSSATAAVLADVAEALAKDHQVIVLAGRPSYAPVERHPLYLWRRENVNGVTVERVGSSAFHRGWKLGRAFNYVSYLALALVRALTMRPRADLVIAMTDPPLVCLVGALAATLRGSTFVYNIRDLHPDMAVAAGVVGDGYFVSLWERLHRWALRRARLVIGLGDDMRDRVVAKGIDPARVVVVRDGARPLTSSNGVDNGVAASIRSDFDFVVLHAGNLGFAGVWDTLLGAAERLKDDGVGLVFVGDGARRTELEEAARDLHNVRFLPYFPEVDLPQVLASADIHVVTVREGLEGLVVPSKLYPILTAGRPVLAIAPDGSDVVRIVRKYSCGLVAGPNDADAVADRVRQARSDSRLLAEMAENARRAAVDFDRDRELARFVQLVEEVVGTR